MLSLAAHDQRPGLHATVRLRRDELGDEAYRRENVAFRDAGRRLGGARDNRVLLETFDAHTRRAREVSNLIAEDHDLAMLAQRAHERRDRFAKETAAGELPALTERQRAELRRDAHDLGRRLFGKKPRKVARALEKSGVALG